MGECRLFLEGKVTYQAMRRFGVDLARLNNVQIGTHLFEFRIRFCWFRCQDLRDHLFS